MEVIVLLYLITFILFISVFMFILGIMYIINGDKLKIEKRIEQIKDIHNLEENNIINKSFSERAIKPIYDSITQFLLRITPGNKIASMNKKLEKAGLLKNNTTEKYLYKKSMISFTSAILSGTLVYLVKPDILTALLISVFIMLLMNSIFSFSLSKKITDRQKIILRDLPYTLDLITVSVEAGLSFDGAIARVVNNLNGELCDEFGKSLKEMRMGIQKKAALKNMSERCDVRELSLLITSLIQADDLGVSLGKVLRIEAANLREHRKQLAREKAMKAPVKMLFPLIFFIFPSIFIIILGPAVIKMLSIF